MAMYIITLKSNSSFRTIAEAMGFKMIAKAVDKNSKFCFSSFSVKNNLNLHAVMIMQQSTSVPGFAGFASFAGVVEITRLDTSEFYYLDELYGNELVFILSFVSSNNTDVETAEQFLLMHTSMFVIFLA